MRQELTKGKLWLTSNRNSDDKSSNKQSNPQKGWSWFEDAPRPSACDLRVQSHKRDMLTASQAATLAQGALQLGLSKMSLDTRWKKGCGALPVAFKNRIMDLENLRNASNPVWDHEKPWLSTERLEAWRAMKRSLLQHFHLLLAQEHAAIFHFQSCANARLIKLAKLMQQSSGL